MRGWIIGLMVAAGVVLGTLSLLFAQGQPTAPSVQTENVITPGTAGNVLFHFEWAFNSISAPNAVWDPNFHMDYTIQQSASNGYSNTVISATTGVSILAQSGTFYTVVDDESWYLPAACTGSACVGVVENVTVTAHATVVTPYHAWFSETTKAVFQSTQNPCSVSSPCSPVLTTGASPTVPPTPTSATQSTFYAQLLVPMFLLVGIEFVAAYFVAGRHPGLLVGGAGSLALAFGLLMATGMG